GPDFVPCPGRHDVVQPVGLGPLRFRGDDVHDVAVVQLLFHGDVPAAYLRSRAGRTHVGMYVESEVEYRGSFGQLAQVAGRGEDEDLLRGAFRVDSVRNLALVRTLLHDFAQA